eukprot:TRINITY_DN4106_c0_g1_i2.p1 TRINITY_DN4106_c0_g1~~TRINITY_DN4106_c0_g1_i2.p1  ORF type:complete len:157 (+),score=14.63 TRINITY_DN4106_c0_g1_i2:20-490(+)
MPDKPIATMDLLDIITIPYIVILYTFLFICYLFRTTNNNDHPKFNVESVDDPCKPHKDLKGNDFVAKRDHRSKYKSNAEQNGLRTFTEIPFYLQGNPWVVDGYRFNYSIKRALKSLFEIHNETWNFWTHIIGSFIFFALLVDQVLLREALPLFCDT